ncbi:peptidase inhibitor family I36 protein [Streptomyces sp. NBC_01497]|uniref:peptidase inhibitor family I36 protein n=1 Tax=Streptomyces sp. NBC_01497 TaxID=2903885 RepID=UPI003FCC911A
MSASAAAVCPIGKVCFYQDSQERGSMSVQDRLTSGPYYSIHDFRNSHYHNNASLNDSISSVVNSSSRCLNLFADPDFRSSRSYRIIMAPGSRMDMDDTMKGVSDNDAMSSAYTYNVDSDGKCDQKVGSQTFFPFVL